MAATPAGEQAHSAERHTHVIGPAALIRAAFARHTNQLLSRLAAPPATRYRASIEMG